MEIRDLPVRSLPGSPRRLLWLALGSSLLLAGCAGDPPKTELAVADRAVTAAETAGAVEFAPLEMKAARDKLGEAERAEQEKDYEKARRLAEQAEWDARVAERKAQAAKVQQALEDARRGVEELREESQRSVQ